MIVFKTLLGSAVIAAAFLLSVIAHSAYLKLGAVAFFQGLGIIAFVGFIIGHFIVEYSQ